MASLLLFMKNYLFLKRRPRISAKERQDAHRAQVHQLVDSICGWLHIIDPTKEAVLRMFQNTESNDEAWRITLANLKTAGNVFDAMTELNVTNERILHQVFGEQFYETMRQMPIADAFEPLKHPS